MRSPCRVWNSPAKAGLKSFVDIFIPGRTPSDTTNRRMRHRRTFRAGYAVLWSYCDTPSVLRTPVPPNEVSCVASAPRSQFSRQNVFFGNLLLILRSRAECFAAASTAAPEEHICHALIRKVSCCSQGPQMGNATKSPFFVLAVHNYLFCVLSSL